MTTDYTAMVPTQDDCEVCGSALVIETTAGQGWAAEQGAGWWACEDDPVHCPECKKIVGGVHCEDGIGWISQGGCDD